MEHPKVGFKCECNIFTCSLNGPRETLQVLRNGFEWNKMETKFGHNFFFSCDLQMALVALPKAFKRILTNLQKLEISHLGPEGKNNNIWVTFDFSHMFFLSSRIVYKWPTHCFPRLSKQFWEISKNLELIILMLRVWVSIVGRVLIHLIF